MESKANPRKLRLYLQSFAALAAFPLLTSAAHAGVYTDLHDFGGIVTLSNGSFGNDGRLPGGDEPNAGVTFDSAGNLFGTTAYGGLNGAGVVWELTAASGYTVYKDLHDFGGIITWSNGSNGVDGSLPTSAVTFDAAGNMYGTTPQGGASEANTQGIGSAGILWELTAASGYTVYKDLHDFGESTTLADGTIGTDGISPTSVAIGPDGSLYGTASGGGEVQGMICKFTTGGVYSDLHDFGETVVHANGQSGIDGQNPQVGVTFDGSGNMYGTTANGGAFYNVPGALEFSSSGGIVWELTSGGVYKDLHDFGGTITNADGTPGPDGSVPLSEVTVDNSGNLYGTTIYGGPFGIQDDGGVLWKIATNGTFSDLHDFGKISQAEGTQDGSGPIGNVAVDAAGDIIGATQYAALVWELSAGGSYQDLHDFGGAITNASGFSGPDGNNPYGVTLDAAGNIYGVTYEGGANNINGIPAGDGIVWKLTSPSLPPVAPIISPPAGEYTTSVTVSISDPSLGSTIYYTTDGSIPSPGSGSTRPYAGSLVLTTDMTVRAIAVTPGVAPSAVTSAVYVVRAADPIFSLGSRHISSPIAITITDSTPHASIYYTLDGSTPNPGVAGTSHYHGVPVEVAPGDTLKAIATIVDGHRSGVKTATYPAIAPPAAPKITPGAGTYTSIVNVNISDATLGVKIYYTTDGTTPVAGVGSTQQYLGTLSLVADTTVKAVASYTNGGGSSSVSSAVYVVQAADPTFSQPGHTITSTINITMSDTTPNASIYYTLDGSTPVPGASGTSHFHGTPVQVHPGDTVTAFATLVNGHRSNTVIAVYP